MFSFITTSLEGWATTVPSGPTKTPKPAPRMRCWETMAMSDLRLMSAPRTPRAAPESSSNGTARETIMSPVLEST